MAGFIFSISKEGWENFIEHDLRFGVFSPYSLNIVTYNISDIVSFKKES